MSIKDEERVFLTPTCVAMGRSYGAIKKSLIQDGYLQNNGMPTAHGTAAGLDTETNFRGVDCVTYPYRWLCDYISTHSETVKQTDDIIMELYRKGKTIDEIIAESGFTERTVQNHVANLATDGEIPFEELIDEETEDIILLAASQLNDWNGRMKAVKEKLETMSYDEISYYQINLALRDPRIAEELNKYRSEVYLPRDNNGRRNEK